MVFGQLHRIFESVWLPGKMPIVDQIRRQVRNELIVAYVTFILAVCLTVARYVRSVSMGTSSAR